MAGVRVQLHAGTRLRRELHHLPGGFRLATLTPVAGGSVSWFNSHPPELLAERAQRMYQSTAQLSYRRTPPEFGPTATMGVPRYVLEKVLGSGSMGVVYRAHDRVLGRTVAIKTIRKELISTDSEYRACRDRFFHEAHIFGSLSHPNIVALYDIGETDDGLPYLTMEYVPDASLGALERRLSLDQVIWLLAQLASAIDYAHTREILHRDIKPTNILLGEGEEAKIADFGVAKVLGAEFTRSQTRFGTPGYMSPEQVLGSTLTRSSDVFSLAVVAFELLSGRKPFPGKSVHSVLYKIVHADPILPTGLEATGLAVETWKEVFATALAKEPQRRYASASELVSELVELCPGSWLGGLLLDEPSVETPGFAECGAHDTLTLYASGVKLADRTINSVQAR